MIKKIKNWIEKKFELLKYFFEGCASDIMVDVENYYKKAIRWTATITGLLFGSYLTGIIYTFITSDQLAYETTIKLVAVGFIVLCFGLLCIIGIALCILIILAIIYGIFYLIELVIENKEYAKMMVENVRKKLAGEK